MWRSGATTLVEFWERFRGDNKWVDAEARVVESRLRDLDLLGKPSLKKEQAVYSDVLIRITWGDSKGTTHSGVLEVPDESPLYQLIEGDILPIRYSSQAPDEFDVRGLARDQAASAAKKIIFAVVLTAVGVLVWFGPDLLMAFSKK